ncbi:hypothetical protein [Pseudoxanthomonas mexicana]
MTEAESSRRRPIIKSVAFSAGEWEAVERRMALANLRFGALARRSILDGSITVKRVAFDPVRFGAGSDGSGTTSTRSLVRRTQRASLHVKT